MKRTSLPIKFQRLLRTVPYVTVATVCADGTPWNTPLVGYFDGNLNLYWSSDTESQHSQNIAANSVISVVVYDSSLPLGQGEALYLKMKAKRLENQAQITQAKRIYLDRYGEDGHEAFEGDCPRRIYKASLVKAWFNTDGKRGGHFIDTRQLLTAPSGRVPRRLSAWQGSCRG